MEYLIHYGIKRRSGRFPWGSGKRPFQSIKDSFAKRRTPEARTAKINKQTSRRMDKIEKKRSVKQKEADKYLEKAIKKSESFFSSQKGVNQALNRSSNAQRNANRLEYKGKRYYNNALKKLDKIGKMSEIDPKVKKLGEQYIKDIENNSKSVYNTLITGNTTIRYKR